MQYSLWVLQILILTAGIHVFLHFVRTTRGNPLIRGLFLSVLVGVVGLWGLATALELDELQHILKGSTGLIVVGLTIIFHPELRRGIAQLGERSVARPSAGPRSDSIRSVAQAARALSARRIGALIAFERETSLRTVVETGSAVHSKVGARLLESLFYPGSPLHDGAVVVRQDQVVAAGCLLPLSKGNRLDSSLGTRHRAAVGLSEETDAIALVVSEETGTVSIACAGELDREVSKDQLETQLRRYIQTGGRAKSAQRRQRFSAFWSLLRRDIGWLAGSFLLACGAIYAAHQSIRETRDFSVRVFDATLESRRDPRDGEILIQPPDVNTQVRVAQEGRFKVSVTGSRAQFLELGNSVRGSVEIEDPEWNGGALDLDLVRWANPVVGLQYKWKAEVPELTVERFAPKRIQLQASDIEVDVTRVDPSFEVRPEDITFAPSPNIEILGPASLMEDIGAELARRLEPIVLAADDRGVVRQRVRLRPQAVAQGFRLSSASTVDVVVDVLPVEREAGSIRKEIALVCMSPLRQDLLDAWTLPANGQTARFTIVTSGLIPVAADLSSPAIVERKAAITRFVEENLRVYVDVAELPAREEGRSAPVRWVWLTDWRESPDAVGVDEGTLGAWHRLDVRLESEPSLLLDPMEVPEGDESP